MENEYKKTIAILSLILFLFICFSGCLNDSTAMTTDAEKIIGTWKADPDITLIFNKNGTCKMQGFFNGDGVWELDDNNTLYITLRFTGGKNYMSYFYEFSADDNILTLSDASDNYWFYTRQ